MTSPFGVNILAQTVRDRNALMTWLTAAQPAAVVCMDDHNLTQQIKKALPNSVIIHRQYNANDANWHAQHDDGSWVFPPQQWLTSHVPFAANGVALQVYNEPVITDAALTWLEQLCKLCPSNVVLALPNFAVGNPHELDILNGKYDRLLRLVCGTPHILTTHEYFVNDIAAEQPFLCGRFRYWERRARVLGLPAPRICITEHGRDIGGGITDGWKGAGWSEQAYYQRLVDAQEHVYDSKMPVCIFCWGTGAANRWQSFDIQDASTLQKALIAWNSLHPITEVTPVPPLPVYPAGTYTLTKIPASYINLRASPNGTDIGDLRVGDVVTMTGVTSGEWVELLTAANLRGWVSLQGGAVVFTPTAAVEPFRLKNPVGCAHVISSKFGVPRDYDGDGVFDDIHEGLDITRAHADCTPLILNGAAGVVTEVSSAGAYGNHVKVSSTVSGVEYVVWYCHMAQMFVVRGMTVKAGDPLGVMGSTGNSTGLHLHLNVQKAGAPTPPGSPVPNVINPEPLIDWG